MLINKIDPITLVLLFVSLLALISVFLVKKPKHIKIAGTINLLVLVLNAINAFYYLLSKI